MRKVIYAIAATILAVAVIFVWSRTALAPLQASTASSISLNQTLAASSVTSIPISPTDMMMKHHGLLPAEQWDAF